MTLQPRLEASLVELQDVLDSGGEKVGRLDEVYYDPATSEPVLLSVKHGLLARQVG